MSCSQETITRYQNGAASTTLAKEFDITSPTIVAALVRAGITPRSKHEALLLFDHAGKMREKGKELILSGEMGKRISAANQGITREEWKEFSSDRWARIYKSQAYQEWKLAVYERDKYICISCKVRGSKDIRINAHHILPKAKPLKQVTTNF